MKEGFCTREQPYTVDKRLQIGSPVTKTFYPPVLSHRKSVAPGTKNRFATVFGCSAQFLAILAQFDHQTAKLGHFEQ